jgi:hypothetical protein
LGSRRTPIDQWSSGAGQRHDLARPQAQNLRQTEQVRLKMALGTTDSRMEPQNHLVFPCLWFGGRPPHELGIRVTQSPGLRRGHQPVSPRGLARPTTNRL